MKAQFDVDCLILPGQNDGLGAVVSGALMVGTADICSEASSAAGRVRDSVLGTVFATLENVALAKRLRTISVRCAVGYGVSLLVTVGTSLGDGAVAEYLLCIMSGEIPAKSCERVESAMNGGYA